MTKIISTAFFENKKHTVFFWDSRGNHVFVIDILNLVDIKIADNHIQFKRNFIQELEGLKISRRLNHIHWLNIFIFFVIPLTVPLCL